MWCSEWNTYVLSDIAEYSKGKIVIDEVSTLNYISTENMLQDKKGVVEASSIPNSNSVPLYKKGNILISNIRPYFKKIWFADGDGGASTDVLVIKNKNSEIITDKFLYYTMFEDKFFDYVMSGSKGTKMPRGDKNSIMKYKVTVPTIKEQKRITEIFENLDEKINLNNEMNKTLEELAQALFKRWFVEFEFPNEDGEPYKSSEGAMIESELGIIPKGWQVNKIQDIGDVVAGGTPSTKIQDYYDGDISWITPKDLSGYDRKFISKGERSITKLGLDKSSAKLMKAGSVLFSSRAPIGYIVIAENNVTTNQGFKSIVCNEELINNNYVYHYLKFNKENIENVASGSTFKEVSGSTMKNIEILLPLKYILDKFKEVTASYDEILRKNYLENDSLIEMRDSLLPKLMSGEIRVEDIEANL
ncbi:MAG: restriction endonuclease subunit S [Clostridium sp.]